jgi:hypothetical protein
MITDQEDTSSSSSTTCSSSSSSSSSSLLCQRLDGSRIDDLWKRLEVDILGNSLPEMDFHRPPRNNLRSNASFVNMVTESFKYFTPERLQRSSLFPGAPLHDIMDILERKLSNASAEPLRVMVFGGSPTAGHGCIANPVDTNIGPPANVAFHGCAWGSRLNDMLDGIFGKGVVEITNVAFGGASSIVSVVLLEYGIWPAGYVSQGPDLILWGHSINDHLLHDEQAVSKGLEQFHQAAEKVRLCNDKLPYVVYVDDCLADMPESVEGMFDVSTTLHRLTTWHHTMGISYANMIRQDALSIHDHDSSQRHPGMLHHIAVAWSILFNLLNSMGDTCYRGYPSSSLPGGLQQPFSKDIPSLTREALKLEDVPNLWKNETLARKDQCKNVVDDAGSRCMYKWIASRMFGIELHDHLTNILKPHLTHNKGWIPLGKPIRSPKLCWHAEHYNATFELKIPVESPVGARFFTLMAMTSYGDGWQGSLLQVSVQIAKAAQVEGQPVVFNISGYHEDMTSISIPHKLEIPQADQGDTVIANFEVIGGKTFKIFGMALCSR